MASADAAWLHMDRPTNRMIIVSVLILEAPLDVVRLRRLLERRLVARFPRFRQRVVGSGPLGAPHWQDDPDFDLGLHLHRVALPAPGDEAALQELVADLMAGDLDHDRPLWEIHLVEGCGDGCALVIRLHHCVADGIALSRVMLELTDGRHTGTASRALAPPSVPGRSRVGALVSPARALVSPARALATAPLAVARRLRHPGELDDLGRDAAGHALALAQLLTAPVDPASTLKGHHGAASHVAWTPALALDDVKAVAHATDTTVNDVLLSALAGALADAVTPDGDGPPRIHAIVPFDVRPPDAPVPAELGNRFGLVFARLPLEPAGPLERLAAVHEEMTAIKGSRQPAVSYAALRVMGAAPAAVEARLIDLFSAKGSAVVTDVPGPRRTVRLAGVAISDAFVWAPCAGSVGMSVSIFSYRDTVRVGFLTHAGLRPSPQRLAQRLVTELDALRAARPGA